MDGRGVDPREHVLGLDLSLTGTGWCVLDEDGIVDSGRVGYQLRKAGPIDRMERVRHICAEIERVWRDHEPRAYGVEDYAFSRNSKAMTGLAELGGAVKDMIWRRARVPPYVVTASAARRYVFGKTKKPPKGKTKEMLRTLAADIGIAFDTEDELDAWIVARVVGGCVGLDPLPTPDQLFVIDELHRKMARTGKKTGA